MLIFLQRQQILTSQVTYNYRSFLLLTRCLQITMAAKGKPNPQDPNIAWDRMKVNRSPRLMYISSPFQVKQRVDKIELVDPSTPKKDGHTRFVCISDTHNKTQT